MVSQAMALAKKPHVIIGKRNNWEALFDNGFHFCVFTQIETSNVHQSKTTYAV